MNCSSQMIKEKFLFFIQCNFFSPLCIINFVELFIKHRPSIFEEHVEENRQFKIHISNFLKKHPSFYIIYYTLKVYFHAFFPFKKKDLCTNFNNVLLFPCIYIYFFKRKNITWFEDLYLSHCISTFALQTRKQKKYLGQKISPDFSRIRTPNAQYSCAAKLSK